MNRLLVALGALLAVAVVALGALGGSAFWNHVESPASAAKLG